MARLSFVLLIVLIMGCVEPIEFNVPPAESLMIIEGMISDQEGPYSVKLSRAISLDSDTLDVPPVTGASIRLHDDLGNIEDFEEVEEGLYQTRGAMKGEIGRSYHITVTTANGEVFESTPELIRLAGEVLEIRKEFKEDRQEGLFGEINKDHFNIYIDATQGPDSDSYTRWFMKGTYEISTSPELRETIYHPGAVPLKEPRPCSGYTTAVHPSGVGTIIVKVGECKCCVCYVTDFEKSPQISDNLLAKDGVLNNVKIGQVAVNSATFMVKYMVTVQQMSLSREAFDFFKLINIQKEQASNIFQPSSGELIGNIKALNAETRVVGLFWATAINEKIAFIQREDVPYGIPPFPVVEESCLLAFRNSTTDKPEAW